MPNELEDFRFILLFFQFAPAIIFTLVSGIAIFYVIKGFLRPKYLWGYISAVLVVTAVWRSLIAFLQIDSDSPFTLSVQSWVTPMNQAIFLLLGISILLIISRYRGKG